MLNKGNIVKFKCGFWGDTDSYETNRFGVIEYSYGERYGNGEIYGGYSVLDKETGCSSAWWDEDKLEFVSDGGENEIVKCKEIAKSIRERNEDLDYIKVKMLDGTAENIGFSSASILKLFHEIDFISSFERNGEFYFLYADWARLYPLFMAIFKKDYDSMIELLNMFKEGYREKYKGKAIAFYNKINK